MKIAIELSGHIRTCAIVPSILTRFQGHELDWYVHTYSDYGFSINGTEPLGYDSSVNRIVARNLQRGNIASLLQGTNIVSLSMECTEDVSAELQGLASRLVPKNSFDNSINVLSLWRKRFLCSQERKSLGRIYDYVIVTRPDIFWHHKRFCSYKLFSRHLCLPAEYKFGKASDVTAIGPPLAIDHYTSLYQCIEWLYHQNGNDINPHSVLLKHLENSIYNTKIMGLSIIRQDCERKPHLGMRRTELRLRSLMYANCRPENY